MAVNTNNPLDNPQCDRCGETQSVVVHDGVPYPYCPNCGDKMPESPEPDQTELCELCHEQRGWISHHTSYLFDVTIDVCSECHGRIHDSTDTFSEYEPTISRQEAIRRGFYSE